MPFSLLVRLSIFMCLLVFIFQAQLPDRPHCFRKGRDWVTSFFKNTQPQALETEFTLFLPRLASPLVLSALSKPPWLLLSMGPWATMSCYVYLLLNLSCHRPHPYCLAQASPPGPWEKRNHLPGFLVPIFFSYHSRFSWPPFLYLKAFQGSLLPAGLGTTQGPWDSSPCQPFWSPFPLLAALANIRSLCSFLIRHCCPASALLDWNTFSFLFSF